MILADELGDKESDLQSENSSHQKNYHKPVLVQLMQMITPYDDLKDQ